MDLSGNDSRRARGGRRKSSRSCNGLQSSVDHTVVSKNRRGTIVFLESYNDSIWQPVGLERRYLGVASSRRITYMASMHFALGRSS